MGLVGKADKAWDKPEERQFSTGDGKFYVGHEFGITFKSHSIQVNFESIAGRSGHVVMLDCKPGGDTFSVLDKEEMKEFEIEDYDDGKDCSFKPEVGIRAIFTPEELALFIEGLQKLQVRMANCMAATKEAAEKQGR